MGGSAQEDERYLLAKKKKKMEKRARRGNRKRNVRDSDEDGDAAQCVMKCLANLVG